MSSRPSYSFHCVEQIVVRLHGSCTSPWEVHRGEEVVAGLVHFGGSVGQAHVERLEHPSAKGTSCEWPVRRGSGSARDDLCAEKGFDAVRLTAATGMRRGELRGLRWSDVHLDTGRVELPQPLTAVGYTTMFSRLKSKTSRRCITLDSGTVRHLKTWQKGAAYPDFSARGLRDADRAVLGADDAGVPDLEHLDAELGEFAQSVKSSHLGGPAHWNALVHQTAPMVAGPRRPGARKPSGRSMHPPSCSPAAGTNSSPSPSSSSPARSAERPGALRTRPTGDTTIQVDAQVGEEPDEAEVAQAVRTLKLLADETRLRIVWNLLHGEHSVNELADHLDMQPAAISHHLAKLRLTGVVRTRRDGNRIYYATHDRHIESLVAAALHHHDRTDARSA
jgi:DNA-binding transcriptional ArsR family regulator